VRAMRVSLLHCILLFIVGWIGGLLLMQYFFDSHSTPSLRAGFAYEGGDHHAAKGGVAGLITTVGKVIADYSHLSATTPAPTATRRQHFLPKFSADTNASLPSNGEPVHIFLDWPVDARLFTVDNYKALESLLTVYPAAVFRCILATSRDAYTHKIGNALAVTQFLKYKKRRYNINVVPVNTKHKSMTSSMGEKYRLKWYNSCCRPCNGTCLMADHTQPYHLLSYIRLTSLYQHGGIFSDFSHFFLGPLTAHVAPQVRHGFGNPLLTSVRLTRTFVQGYAITSGCGNQYHLESWQSETAIPANGKESHVRDRMGRKRKAARGDDCVTSTLLVFHTPQHAAVQCVLARYDDSAFLKCLDEDVTFGGALCVKNAFDKCFASLKLENALVTPSENSGGTVAANAHNANEKEVPGYDYETSVIETFDQNAFRASNTLLSYDWSLQSQRRVFWLGSLAWTGSWKHYPYRNGTLLHAAVSTISLKGTYFPDLTTSAQCKGVKTAISCSHYSKNLTVLVRSGGIRSDSSLRLTGTAAVSGQYSYNTGVEEASCAPTVVVAGFQKSASAFLFDALTRHPSVLPAIAGAQHKDTHCYSTGPGAGVGARRTEKLLQRAWCYPFVESGEPFVSVDGTVAYSQEYDVPTTVKEVSAGLVYVALCRRAALLERCEYTDIMQCCVLYRIFVNTNVADYHRPPTGQSEREDPLRRAQPRRANVLRLQANLQYIREGGQL
jgi:hypothetical protein